MFAVVGCGDCQALWVLEGRPERSECPRCGTTRKHAFRRKFLETDDPDRAREARARLLASEQGYETEFGTVDSFTELEKRLSAAGPSETEQMEAAGVDPTAVAEAGERASSGPASGSSGRRETVREALRRLDEPDREAVVAYAGERGVSREYVERALRKLARAGEVSEDRGTYRLV